MIEINELKQTCMACPSQWEFYTFDNRPVYVRYRWGFLSVCIGKENGVIMDAVRSTFCFQLPHLPKKGECGVEIIGKELGNSLDGFIVWNQAEKELNKLTKKEVLNIIHNETQHDL